MKKIVLIISSCLLSCCSLISAKTDMPPPVVNNKWSSSSPGIMVKNVNYAIESQNLTWWWTKYNDKTLNNLMESAFANNNQLQIAAANTDYANAQLKSIEFAWIPNLSFLTGYSSFPAMGSLGYFYGGMASYSLNVFQQIKAQEQAKYIVKATEYQQKSVQLGVIGQVAVSYFSLLAYREQLEIYEKLNADLVEILKLNNQRFKTGVSSQKEPYISASEISQIQAKTQIIKHNIVLTQNAIKYLTNQNPGTIAVTKKFSDINADLIVVSELPLTALNNRPDIQEASSRLEAANAGIGIAQSELLPTISFANFYRGAAPNFGNSFTTNDLNQMVLAIPVINAQAFADIAARNAIYKQIYFHYMQSVVAALRDIDNDISEHAQYTVQLNDNLRALGDIDKTCYLDKARFDSGVSSYLEYMNCITKYDYYRLTIVQLKLGKIMAMVKLYQDLAITKN